MECVTVAVTLPNKSPVPVVDDTILNDTHSKPLAAQSEFETESGCGTRLTVPVTLIVSVVAPVEVIITLPETLPDAASSFKRIYTVVVATAPLA